VRYFCRTPAKQEEITPELGIIGETGIVSTELKANTLRDTRTKDQRQVKNAKGRTEKRAKQEEIIPE